MKGLWNIIKAMGNFIIGLGGFTIGIFVIIGLIIALGARNPQQLPSVPDGAVLVLWPEGQIVEITELPDPFAALYDDFNRQPAQTSIHDITDALNRAKDDDRISALALVTDSMAGAGPSHIHTIAAAVKDFKSSGKKVYALSSGYSQSDYLVAAEADKIYMNPQGNVLLTGYGSYPMYFKSLLDKIGATVNVFRVGTFKSAVEPFIRNDMSDAAKEANSEFLGTLWQQYQTSVTQARSLKAGKISSDIEDISGQLKTAGGDFAVLALNSGLVDELAPRSKWRDDLMEEFGANDYGNSFKQIDFQSYLAATSDQQNGSNQIAVITAQGEIVMGDGPVSVAAAETIVGYIRSARNNSSTSAIVLRVDSPGGSSFASELIRQELVAAQNQGIKVIASFGPVAASGGYWIAATADEIWAAPSSITGSIGIFGIIPTYENTLDKIGVRTDGVGTTPLAGAFNVTRPLSDLTKDVIQQSIESGYGQFLSLVAKGRNMTVENVDKIAQGRVWVGTKAKELGLVDHLGGFDDAVAAAARAAGVEDNHSVVFYREQPDQFDQMIANILNSSVGSDELKRYSAPAPSPIIKAAMNLLDDSKFLANLNDPLGRYLICFECKVR